MLVPKLTLLSQRLNRLHGQFGDPRYKVISLVLGQATTVLSPALRVVQIGSQDSHRVVKGVGAGSWLTDNVQIMGDEVIVMGIPRTYDETLVARSRYFIDGQKYELLYLDRSDMLTYNAVVKPFRDR